MKSKQLTPVVYAGKVGARLKPLKPRVRKEPMKHAFFCVDGPMLGNRLWLSSFDTAVFTYCGETGRYVAGKWEAKNA